MQGRFQTLRHKAFPHTGHRGYAHIQSLTDRFVGPTRPVCGLVGFEQDARMGMGAGGGFAGYD